MSETNPTTETVPTQLVATMVAGVPLLMVEAQHEQFMRSRFKGRPMGRAKAADGKERGPESVARMPNAQQTGGYGYAIDGNGIAVVSIKGAITPEAWAWYDEYETISDWVVRDLAAMENDPNVKGLVQLNDSPGGYVAGSFEMADAFARFAAKKPTATVCGSYCCSAAYLQAVQTAHITAYKTSIVGSIGTRSAVYDWSKFFEKFGVKAIPIDSGGMKSAGMAGTEITAEQIEYFRSTVLKLQELFTAEVAKGRGLSIEQALALADGRVYVAADAKAKGLIDAIGTKDDARQRLIRGGTTLQQPAGAGDVAGETESQAEAAVQGVPAGSGADATEAGDTSPEKGPDMSQTNPAPSPTAQEPPKGASPQPTPAAPAAAVPATVAAAAEPKPATIAELKAAFPGDANASFVLAAAENAWTIGEARSAHGVIESQVASRAAAAKPEPVAKKPGIEPSPSAAAEQPGVAASAGSNAHPFIARRDELVAKGMSRMQAVMKIAAEEPALHQSYLDSQKK